MKPLSEKELREKLLNHFTGGAPSYRAANESGQAAARSLAEPILEMWLQDRKAWGEYVIGTSSLSMVMSPAIRLKNGHIDTSWTDEHDKYKAAYIEDGLRAEQRQRNQGEKK